MGSVPFHRSVKSVKDTSVSSKEEQENVIKENRKDCDGLAEATNSGGLLGSSISFIQIQVSA